MKSKKTTTQPPRPSGSADRTEVDHTQCVCKALHKGDIRMQTANKPPPTTQFAFSACFHYSKQLRHCDSMIANSSFLIWVFFLVLYVDKKNKLWFAGHQEIHILCFRVCFVSCSLCLCVREWKMRH